MFEECVRGEEVLSGYVALLLVLLHQYPSPQVRQYRHAHRRAIVHTHRRLRTALFELSQCWNWNHFIEVPYETSDRKCFVELEHILQFECTGREFRFYDPSALGPAERSLGLCLVRHSAAVPFAEIMSNSSISFPRAACRSLSTFLPGGHFLRFKGCLRCF